MHLYLTIFYTNNLQLILQSFDYFLLLLLQSPYIFFLIFYHSFPLLYSSSSYPIISSLTSLISFIYNCFYISDVDTSPDKVRVVARERAIHPDMYHQQIGYSNKNETCILYPKLPKAWLANGFVIIPSLSEKGEVTFIYLY